MAMICNIHRPLKLATAQMAELEAVNARLVTDLSQKTNEKPEMHQASGFSELQTTHRCLTPMSIHSLTATGERSS